MRFSSLAAFSISLWVKISLANYEVPPCDYKYLTQTLDHTGNATGTFQQRYSIYDEFFKPGGPILFFQGEESTYLDCANDTIFYEWAKELNGMAVSLEHRYFGTSKPFGSESNTTKNFKFLTLDNVMADAAAFIDQIKQNNTDAKDSKTIVASGSYGGFLTGAFVLNRPDDFYGAIASAGTVMGWGNGSDPESYNWWNWANRVYTDHSLEASKKIQTAFTKMDQILASNDTTQISQFANLTNICTPISPGNATQISMLHNVLEPVFFMVLEFNYPYAKPGRSPIAYPFNKTLDIALNAEDPLEIIGKVNRLWQEPLGIPCVDFEDLQFTRKLVPAIEADIFRYVGCTYYPIHAAAYISNTTIFPPRGPPDPGAGCELSYNLRPLTKSEMETRYNFSSEKIQNSKRIIWSKGEYDPAAAVGPASLPLDSGKMGSRVLEAVDVAHREDLFRSEEVDRQGVQLLRRKELEIIKGWLEGEEEEEEGFVSQAVSGKLESRHEGLKNRMGWCGYC